jgi:hypothetical protein
MQLSEMTKHEGGRYHDGERFLPWYTSPCLEWLITLNLNGRMVYEFGVGDSTAWYRSRGAVTAGVDSNFEYAQKFNAMYGRNQEEYLGFINFLDLPYDIIIVDGSYRDECAGVAWKHLKIGGYLILDNWEQASVEPSWPKTKKIIHGREQELFVEFGHYDPWQTLVVKK